MTTTSATRPPLYEVMRRNLLELIETEHINNLPNEKELMTRYKVSRNTLRRAILELTNEGILQPMQGIGTLVHPVSGLKEDSRVLLIYDVTMRNSQREIFLQLLFRLGQSKLRTTVFMIDKDAVDVPGLESRLKECDAVIVDADCSFSAAIRDQVVRCGKKRVCLHWDATRRNLSSVGIDVSEGSYLLLKHLLELGHRKFLLLWNSNDAKRRAGFTRALAEHGLDFSCLHEIEWQNHFKEGESRFGMKSEWRKFAMRFAKITMQARTDETAVIVNDDDFALCVEEVALASGLRIPEDISVVGYGNLIDSAYFPVPLTTCSGSTEEIINEAIAYLFSSRKPNELFYAQVTPELVIRQSTGPARK